MEILRKIPYILLFLSIFISTLVGMLANITFLSFLKRTILFYVVIFLGSYMGVSNVLKAKITQNTAKDSSVQQIDLIIPSEQPELYNKKDDEQTDFIPIDFKNYDTNYSSKPYGKTNGS
ncbi:hypothetical protein [Thermotalea metallivorans]|uniref:Uncharacterized protein n=1 Tax=Thermotalea metallivorans TaxID=520762 RepID=A0A140L5E9_9FIRM|nr:hypothetical protein [Thermotalea metallivorans]KXG75774.1 hypothetical protein AN619_15280 [Thermotalea metallivorans]